MYSVGPAVVSANVLIEILSGSPVPLEADAAVVVPVAILPDVDAFAVVVNDDDNDDVVDDDTGDTRMLVRSGQSIFKSIGTSFLNPKIMNNFLNCSFVLFVQTFHHQLASFIFQSFQLDCL